MKRLLGLLVGGLLLFWLVLVYPAWLLGGESGVVFSSVAGVICLVPTVVTMSWCLATSREAPEQRLIAVLGGMGVRLVVVLGAGMVLFHALPYFHYRTFWIWVIVFYLFSLTLEVGLLSTRPPTMDHSQQS